MESTLGLLRLVGSLAHLFHSIQPEDDGSWLYSIFGGLVETDQPAQEGPQSPQSPQSQKLVSDPIINHQVCDHIKLHITYHCNHNSKLQVGERFHSCFWWLHGVPVHPASRQPWKPPATWAWTSMLGSPARHMLTKRNGDARCLSPKKI